MSSLRFLCLLLMGLRLSACSPTVLDERAQVTPHDPRRASPEFTDGYRALKDHDFKRAQQELEVAYARTPDDPCDALDLGAAYQSRGLIDRALPLLKQAAESGRGLPVAEVTDPADQGKTIEQIAKKNLRLAGFDEYGIPFARPRPQATSAMPRQAVFHLLFEFGKADLTPAAREMIFYAAAQALGDQSATVRIIAHTDAVGSDVYNLRLSQRRADMVSSALQVVGVSAARIIAMGVGKYGPLEPTVEGIREPQNRRAEILVSSLPTW